MWERIGRLKEKQHGIGQHYQIDLQTDESGEKALSITWQKHSVPGSYVDLPGVYCLRKSIGVKLISHRANARRTRSNASLPGIVWTRVRHGHLRVVVALQ